MHVGVKKLAAVSTPTALSTHTLVIFTTRDLSHSVFAGRSGMLEHCCRASLCSASAGDFLVPMRVLKLLLLMTEISWYAVTVDYKHYSFRLSTLPTITYTGETCVRNSVVPL